MITQQTSKQLLQWLLVMLDAVDYTNGACRPNELVGGVLDADVLASARTIAKTALLEDQRNETL